MPISRFTIVKPGPMDQAAVPEAPQQSFLDKLKEQITEPGLDENPLWRSLKGFGAGAITGAQGLASGVKEGFTDPKAFTTRTAPALIRAGSALAAAPMSDVPGWGTLAGGATGAGGELVAEGLEGSLWDQSPWRSAAKIGTAGALSAIPVSSTIRAGKVLSSMGRGGAFAGGGEAARELAAGESLDPMRIGTSTAVGTVTGGVLGKMLGLGGAATPPAGPRSTFGEDFQSAYPNKAAYEASKVKPPELPLEVSTDYGQRTWTSPKPQAPRPFEPAPPPMSGEEAFNYQHDIEKGIEQRLKGTQTPADLVSSLDENIAAQQAAAAKTRQAARTAEVQGGRAENVADLAAIKASDKAAIQAEKEARLAEEASRVEEARQAAIDAGQIPKATYAESVSAPLPEGGTGRVSTRYAEPPPGQEADDLLEPGVTKRSGSVIRRGSPSAAAVDPNARVFLHDDAEAAYRGALAQGMPEHLAREAGQAAIPSGTAGGVSAAGQAEDPAKTVLRQLWKDKGFEHGYASLKAQSGVAPTEADIPPVRGAVPPKAATPLEGMFNRPPSGGGAGGSTNAPLSAEDITALRDQGVSEAAIAKLTALPEGASAPPANVIEGGFTDKSKLDRGEFADLSKALGVEAAGTPEQAAGLRAQIETAKAAQASDEAAQAARSQMRVVPTEPLAAPVGAKSVVLPEAAPAVQPQSIAEFLGTHTAEPGEKIGGNTGAAYRKIKAMGERGEATPEQVAAARDAHLRNIKPELFEGKPPAAPALFNKSGTGSARGTQSLDELSQALKAQPAAPAAVAEPPSAEAGYAQDLSDLESLSPQSRAAAIKQMIADFAKGESGAVSTGAAAKMGSTGLGALLGGVVGSQSGDEENKGRNAVLGAIGGGAAGAGGAQLAQLLSQPGVVDKILQTIPKWQRSSMLTSNPNSTLANVFAGPWGSGAVMALEKGLSGDPRGWTLLGKLMNPRQFGRDFTGSLDEAQHLIGRAEGSALGANPSMPEKLMALPGTAMTAGDMATKAAIERSGFSPQQARRATLTSEPEFKAVKQIADFGKGASKNPKDPSKFLTEMAFPFKRTPANIFEQGMMRMPLVGSWVQSRREVPDSMREQIVQQLMNAGAGATGYGLGSSLDPETAKTVRKYGSNFFGPHSMMFSGGFAAGQSKRAGQPALSGKTLQQFSDALPLPTSQAFQDWLKLAAGLPQGELNIPKGMIPFRTTNFGPLGSLLGGGEEPSAPIGPTPTGSSRFRIVKP